MISYGLPYVGSKNRLAKRIIKHFPEADTLVDGFFGGGAITHCAMVHNRFRNYIANDLRTTPQFFKECMEGKHSNNTKWVSHEDFYNSPRDDWFVRLLWSYSNTGNVYVYGRKYEPIKKAFHYAICFNDFSLLEGLYPKSVCDTVLVSIGDIPIESWNERRLAAQRVIARLLKAYPEKLQKRDFLVGKSGNKLVGNLECLQRVKNLECLQRVKNLERIQSLNIECYNLDYRLLTDIIPDNSVVYLDPPYKNAHSYCETSGKGIMRRNPDLFNTDEFLDWAYAIGQKHPVFISEYDIDDSRFTLVDEWPIQGIGAGRGSSRTVTERLYTVK